MAFTVLATGLDEQGFRAEGFAPIPFTNLWILLDGVGFQGLREFRAFGRMGSFRLQGFAGFVVLFGVGLRNAGRHRTDR